MSTQMSMPANQTLQVPFVDLAAQYSTIADEINETTSRIIQKADFILGREVRLFEEEFAAFSEARYAVGVDSGTSALELALRARSEEHTSELQSLAYLVCRLLLEKKK